MSVKCAIATDYAGGADGPRSRRTDFLREMRRRFVAREEEMRELVRHGGDPDSVLGMRPPNGAIGWISGPEYLVDLENLDRTRLVPMMDQDRAWVLHDAWRDR